MAAVVQADDVASNFVTNNDVCDNSMCQCCLLLKADLQVVLTEIKLASEIINILTEEHKHCSVTRQEYVLDNVCEDKSKICTYECYKCSLLERQLKETLNELNSMKLITSILSEEIKTLKQTPITDICDNSWTTVESRNSHRQTTFQPSSAVNLIHKFPVANRYTVLSNHHESQECDDWSSLPSSEQRSKHKPMKVKRSRIKKTLPVIQPCWPMNHQSHESRFQESVKNEDWISPIPTIENGVINNDCNAKYTLKYNDKIEDTVSKLTETIIACNKNAVSKKHKIVFIGDSHIKGYVSNLKFLLNNKFELYSIVKPGSSTDELKETAKKEVSELSQDDLIVICSGTNDYEINEFSLTFQNISNFIKTNNHTNIILINVPFRYDLCNSVYVNSYISTLNRKLKKLVKVFPHTKFLEVDNNRKLFTKHGLHLNKLGKQLITYQLASFIHSIFEQKTICRIILSWHDKSQDNNNLVHDGNQDEIPSRNSRRNRKIPVTRTQDFLWQI
jgi:lysophospholipase L1-like esterase